MLQTHTIKALVLAHIVIICLSNTLVQYPFTVFGLHTTWGAFSYPLIFVLTDLSTRLSGQQQARQIIFIAMLPALLCSYLISNYYAENHWLAYNSVVLRIALASFCAYLVGQLLDITIFQGLRRLKQWWVAPAVSNIFGNIFDTYCFFFIAFYQGENAFLSAHWTELARVDLVVKLLIGLLSFVPLYGLILKRILRQNTVPAF